MGHKSVCFNCKKAFSLGTDFTKPKHRFCPECKGEVFVYPHRFRPPEKSDTKKWAVVEFLKQNGFYYQHIRKFVERIYENAPPPEDVFKNIEYPETMRGAKEFVKEYIEFKITKK
jgi:intergrase/recombinase